MAGKKRVNPYPSPPGTAAAKRAKPIDKDPRVACRQCAFYPIRLDTDREGRLVAIQQDPSGNWVRHPCPRAVYD